MHQRGLSSSLNSSFTVGCLSRDEWKRWNKGDERQWTLSVESLEEGGSHLSTEILCNKDSWKVVFISWSAEVQPMGAVKQSLMSAHFLVPPALPTEQSYSSCHKVSWKKLGR